jgi:hypothetical protein
MAGPEKPSSVIGTRHNSFGGFSDQFLLMPVSVEMLSASGPRNLGQSAAHRTGQRIDITIIEIIELVNVLYFISLNPLTIRDKKFSKLFGDIGWYVDYVHPAGFINITVHTGGTTAGENALVPYDFGLIRDGLFIDFSYSQMHFERVRKSQRILEIKAARYARPAGTGIIPAGSCGQTEVTEELMFGSFHITKIRREMNDSRHVRIHKFNTSCHNERIFHTSFSH